MIKMPLSAYLPIFKAYLKLEKGSADSTITSYLRDVGKFNEYLTEYYPDVDLNTITLDHGVTFVGYLMDLGVGVATQSRTLSGLKAFFTFLRIENILKDNPLALLDHPKSSRKLPAVLSISEIDAMINAIDHSYAEGVRNRAIIETLYGCGLRVSELTNLKISGFYPEIQFIRVVGKGNKERLIPINESAIKHILIYLSQIRQHQKIKEGKEDFLFLNRRGNPLSRVMIFYIVKDLAQKAGIQKTVSPHTFRHSFATHLYEGGADLRIIQDMLGHESITTTEIYAKVEQTHLRAVMERFHPRF